MPALVLSRVLDEALVLRQASLLAPRVASTLNCVLIPCTRLVVSPQAPFYTIKFGGKMKILVLQQFVSPAN